MRTLKETMEIVCSNGNPEKPVVKSTAYSRFHSMTERYNLNEKYFKLKNQEDAYYDISNMDLDFLRFAYDIFNRDPNMRANSKPANFNLEKYKRIADYIRESIAVKRYPLIQDILVKSVSTEEFYSIDLLQTLSNKTAKVFAYACVNNHVDYTIYEDLSKYLDKLLYSYSIHGKIPKLMRSWIQNESSNNKAYIKNIYVNGNNEISTFDRNDGSPDQLRMFNGIANYIERLYNDMTNTQLSNMKYENGKRIMALDNVKKLYVTYDFNDTQELNDFLKSYVNLSCCFREQTPTLLEFDATYLFYCSEALCNYLIGSTYNIRFMNCKIDINQMEEFRNNAVNGFLFLMEKLHNHRMNKLKKASKLCEDHVSKILHYVSKHLSDDSLWILSQYNCACAFFASELRKIRLETNNDLKYFLERHHISFQPNSNIIYGEEYINLLCQTCYKILEFCICYQLFLLGSRGLDKKVYIPCVFQIRYKGFIFELNHIYNLDHHITISSGLRRITDLIDVIEKTEKELISFDILTKETTNELATNKFQDNDTIKKYQKELVDAIGRDIGIFFKNVDPLVNLSTKSSNNDSKLN